MKQDKRELVQELRAAKTQMLIATDVAARGLDIKQLPIVINWDMPPSIEQYVHRIGRAARHEGNRGIAFTFFTRHYANLAPDMVKLLQSAGQAVDPNMKSAAREYIALQGEAKSAASGEVRSDDEIADVPNSYSGVASLATSCSKPVWTSSEEEGEEEEKKASAEDGSSDKFGQRQNDGEENGAPSQLTASEGARRARLVLVLQVARDLTERYANKTISVLPGLLVGLRGGARRWALKRGLMWVLEMQLMRLVGRNGRRGGQVEAGVVARRTRSESQTHPRSMLSGENRMIESFGMNRPRLQFRMRARSQLSLTNLGARRAQ